MIDHENTYGVISNEEFIWAKNRHKNSPTVTALSEVDIACLC